MQCFFLIKSNWIFQFNETLGFIRFSKFKNTKIRKGKTEKKNLYLAILINFKIIIEKSSWLFLYNYNLCLGETGLNGIVFVFYFINNNFCRKDQTTNNWNPCLLKIVDCIIQNWMFCSWTLLTKMFQLFQLTLDMV